MFCKNCGKEIDDRAAVCIHCGVAVEPLTAVQRAEEKKTNVRVFPLGIIRKYKIF